MLLLASITMLGPSRYNLQARNRNCLYAIVSQGNLARLTQLSMFRLPCVTVRIVQESVNRVSKFRAKTLFVKNREGGFSFDKKC